jgi:hypothetical protein
MKKGDIVIFEETGRMATVVETDRDRIHVRAIFHDADGWTEAEGWVLYEGSKWQQDTRDTIDAFLRCSGGR